MIQFKYLKSMDAQSTIVLSFLSIGVFSFILWVVALVHAATNKNFKENNSKLVWVLVILFAYGIGALLYLLFGRPKEDRPSKPSVFKNTMSTFGVMPLGLKILALLSLYYLVDTTLNLERVFSDINYFGISINQPFSSIYNIVWFAINLIFLISLFKKYLWGWKVNFSATIFSLASFVVLKLPTTIRAIVAPASEIYKIIGIEATSEYQNTVSYSATKLATVSTDLITLAIMLLITIYLYRKKNYFVN